MGVSIVGGSFHVLNQATVVASVLTVPFTVGFWVYPTVGSSVAWSAGGATDIGWRLENYNTGTGWSMYYYNAGQSGQAQTATGGALNAWQYIVMRFIGTTNRRLSVWTPGQAPTHVQGTGSVTPGTLTMHTIGAAKSGASEYGYYSGWFAEYFAATGDIQANNAQLDDQVLRRMAMEGPLSVPHIVPRVVEYRPLMCGVYDRDVLRRGSNWTATNGPTSSAHPPLYGTYVRPNQSIRQLYV
jgi:hypothetical protein